MNSGGRPGRGVRVFVHSGAVRPAVGTLVALLILPACGGGAADQATTPQDAPATASATTGAPTAPVTTAAPPGTSPPGETGSTSPAIISDRPVAPDFTLELGDGGTFVLSEEARPVYLVFWAEW